MQSFLDTEIISSKHWFILRYLFTVRPCCVVLCAVQKGAVVDGERCRRHVSTMWHLVTMVTGEQAPDRRLFAVFSSCLSNALHQFLVAGAG